MPWTSNQAYKHTHKAKSPKQQRQWAHVADSALSRGASEASAIRQANGVIMKSQHHAMGGMQSPLTAIANEKVGMPHMPGIARPPRIPITDTLRNIGTQVHGARVALPKLARKVGGKVKYGDGGEVQLGIRAISALKDALSHLANKDVSSAAATLRASPQAMAHPAVQQAAQSLRSSSGIGPASKTLTDLVNQDTNRTMMPTMGAQKKGGRIKR